MRRLVVLAFAAVFAPVASAASPAPATVTVQSIAAQGTHIADGLVEAVRQTDVAAQIPARIVEIAVKAGDSVRAGQVLLRLDNRAAAGEVAASQAQAAAARAQLEVARSDVERSRRLYSEKYISQAALDQAEAKWKAADAQARASLAQAGIASTQSSFTTIVAPYAGVVAKVNAERGDMAVPGTALMTLYDPAVLRVVAHVPEGRAATIDTSRPVRIDVAGAPAIVATSIQVLPTADPATHTREVRLSLGTPQPALAPGMFARVSLPLKGAATTALTLPASAVVRRPEFNAVYVIGADGRAQLRQVRLGRVRGDDVEILAGIAAGDRVALDPVAAAQQ